MTPFLRTTLCLALVFTGGCFDPGPPPKEPDPPCTVICTPPPATCSDGKTLVTNALHGCTGSVCQFEPSSNLCPSGTCSNGACVDPTCLGVTCNQPPPNVCLDASTLQVAALTGTCSGSTCSYPRSTTRCVNGCRDGACLGGSSGMDGGRTEQGDSGIVVESNDAGGMAGDGGFSVDAGPSCASSMCNAPPANDCVDSLSQRLYSAMGQCDALGACEYVATVRACDAGFGCTAGTCNDIDECAVNNGGCGSNATCGNTSGGRTCTCNNGYQDVGGDCLPLVTLTIDLGIYAPYLRAGRTATAVIGDNRLAKPVPSNGVVTFTDATLAGPQDITVFVVENDLSTRAETVVGFTGSMLYFPRLAPSVQYHQLTATGTLSGWTNWSGLRLSAAADDSLSGSFGLSGGNFDVQLTVPNNISSMNVFVSEDSTGGELIRAGFKRNVATGSSSVEIPLVADITNDWVNVNNLNLYSGQSYTYEALRVGLANIYWSNPATSAAPPAYATVRVPNVTGRAEYAGTTKYVYATTYPFNNDSCVTPCASSEKTVAATSAGTQLEYLPPTPLLSPAIGQPASAPTVSLSTLNPSWATPVTGKWIQLSLARWTTPSFSWSVTLPASKASWKPIAMPAGIGPLQQGLWYFSFYVSWSNAFTTYDALFDINGTGRTATERRSMTQQGALNLY